MTDNGAQVELSQPWEKLKENENVVTLALVVGVVFTVILEFNTMKTLRKSSKWYMKT
jgi:hypothetical protein